ncbi:MAG: hypothetical protein KJ062_09660, partial [Thermoanaerobaculia bacterium]|nr:hypothetical protein [Thermoanaerobaculia bacterium]
PPRGGRGVRTPPVRVRLLRSPAEFLEASLVARSAWGFPDLMVPPPPDMITATHSGGMTAGAFQDGCLLAFVHAVPRTNLPEPAIHSHLLAVSAGAGAVGPPEALPARVVPRSRHRPRDLDLRPLHAPQRAPQPREARRGGPRLHP